MKKALYQIFITLELTSRGAAGGLAISLFLNRMETI